MPFKVTENCDGRHGYGNSWDLLWIENSAKRHTSKRDFSKICAVRCFSQSMGFSVVRGKKICKFTVNSGYQKANHFFSVVNSKIAQYIEMNGVPSWCTYKYSCEEKKKTWRSRRWGRLLKTVFILTESRIGNRYGARFSSHSWKTVKVHHYRVTVKTTFEYGSKIE